MYAWIVLEVQVPSEAEAMQMAESLTQDGGPCSFDFDGDGEYDTDPSIAYVVPAQGPRVYLPHGHTGVVLGWGQDDFPSQPAGEIVVWPDITSYEPSQVFEHSTIPMPERVKGPQDGSQSVTDGLSDHRS